MPRALTLTVLACCVAASPAVGLGRLHGSDDVNEKPATQPADTAATQPADRVDKTDTQWKQELDDEQYRVLRMCGTEPPFDNAYWNETREGAYQCAGCGLLLFESGKKYKSGTGWPSFWDAVDPDYVKKVEDRSHGMVRTEVRCARCDGHLGHVFNDGPKDKTGKRYCMNSAALEFVPTANDPAATQPAGDEDA